MSSKTTSGIEAGLPAEYEPLLLKFFDGPLIPGGWRVIGSDYGCDLQVHLESGSVRAFDPQGEIPTRFVNSSLERFAHCIRAYQQYSADVVVATDESAAKEVVARFRQTVTELDPAATSDPENWWSLILEQNEDGLL
jgi:hypothetical protein